MFKERLIRGYWPSNMGCGMLIIGKLEISYTLPHIYFGEYYFEIDGFRIEWEVRHIFSKRY